MRKSVIKNIKTHIIIFTFFMFVFTLIYKYYCGYSLDNSLYISISYATFTGTNLDTKDQKVKNVSSFQLFFSYIFIIIILNTILNNS
jgi:hypothetical protein